MGPATKFRVFSIFLVLIQVFLKPARRLHKLLVNFLKMEINKIKEILEVHSYYTPGWGRRT